MKRKDFKPQPCQTHLIQHGSELERCAFWAGMGVGKTVTTLTLLNNLWEVGTHDLTLVLAPKRVAKNVWPYENEKWKHLDHTSVSPIIGTPEQRRMALRADANVFTINYENLPWLLEELGRKRWPFANIIADEATRLKGFRLQQGKTRARFIGSVAHGGRVKRWINLTGTPAPNGLQDLWGPTWMLDAGERLGRSYNAFMQRYFRKKWGSMWGMELMPYADQLIHDKIDDICLSVDHELDVHEPVVSNVIVDLPHKARRIYNEMEKRMYAELGTANIEVFNQANKSMKCLQIASGACHVDEDNWEWIHDAKIKALESVINEFAGMPILLAYWWQPTLVRLQKHFGKRLTYLDDKKATENKWNRGEIPILAVHPQSAGHGLNLQDGGNVIVYFDHWWNLELDQQVFERIGPVRQAQSGHDRPVYRVNLVARDTADVTVIHRQKTKASVQQALIDAAKQANRGQGPEIV